MKFADLAALVALVIVVPAHAQPGMSFGQGVSQVGSAAVGQIPGTPTNDSASAGNVGETASCLVASGSAVALTSGALANVCSFQLTPGQWHVCGIVDHHPAATTVVASIKGFINTNSANYPGLPNNGLASNSPFPANFVPNDEITSAGFCADLKVATTQTYYLEVVDYFSTSSMAAYGAASAYRTR